MKENHFIFADLSTYDTNVAQQFYGAVFGWQYHDAGDNYLLAYAGQHQATGLYETPQKFKDMRMPPFWMSYIQVNSVDATVQIAREQGGIIEAIEDNAIGKVALIRDPLGAGFTVYEGDALRTRTQGTANTLVNNELFISDIDKIKPFYESVFHWRIEAVDNNRYAIHDKQNQVIGAINEVSNDVKGKYEYWSVFFAVQDIAAAKKAVLAHGGSVVWEMGDFICLADASGGFFHVVKSTQSHAHSGAAVELSDATHAPRMPWKAWLGLALVYVGVFFEQYWVFGLLALFWLLFDIRSGATHLFETISRRQNPILFWLIIATWGILSGWSILF